ncbi:hypothetical protein [uncultured Prevotella sp.]|uniref:hypothetical protein n=1 Tax=uncultured Prevotella sp. TaxID=159272 RepID=UPI002631FC3E|nr:hypothetical protein [uncultured Prevotella sp.]
MNLLQKAIHKTGSMNLAAVGVVMLILEVIILTIHYICGLNNNIPLWAALAMTFIGITLIIMQIKRKSDL